MPDYRSLYDRDYIGHFDLPGGKDTTLTIKRVVGGELTAMGGRKSKKPIVHFAADVKPLICNKTNGKTIAAMYGNEVKEWTGKRITLFVSMTRNPDGGSEVECIRVRPKVPGSGTDTPIAPRQEPEEHIIQTEPAASQTDAEPPSASTSPSASAAPSDAQIIASIAVEVGKQDWNAARDLARGIRSERKRLEVLARIGEKEAEAAIP